MRASEIMTHLKGITLPTTRKELLDKAKANNAPPAVLEKIEKMGNIVYPKISDVMRGLKGL